MRSVKPPFGLNDGGRDLWTACLKQDDALTDASNPLRRLLLDACRLADQCDALHQIVTDEGVSVDTDSGFKVNPALVELGKQRSLLARLLMSLRMPDEQTGKKPQRRGAAQPRGANKPGGKSGTVSSLERARRAAGA